MKKTDIALLVLIALSIVAIFGALIDSSTYADFETAFTNEGKEYHVAGELVREQPIVYDPEVNASLTEFYLRDSLGVEKKIMLHKSKPQDFERSEKIVVVGSAKDGDFHAEDVLMKCPSKYNEEEVLKSAGTAVKD